MPLWYRVFGASDVQPEPEALLQQLRGVGGHVTGQFRGDEQGWFHAELHIADDKGLIELNRYLATEEGIRHELNSWAAWLESVGEGPTHQQLMRHMVATAQLFVLQAPTDFPLLDRLSLCLCQFLARGTDGVYQVDGLGVYSSEGVLLVPEA